MRRIKAVEYSGSFIKFQVFNFIQEGYQPCIHQPFHDLLIAGFGPAEPDFQLGHFTKAKAVNKFQDFEITLGQLHPGELPPLQFAE